MSRVKKLRIDASWCKGCGICVAFCPRNVLKLENDRITVADEENCIKCGLCELRCPDYAIWLEESEDE
ncbi:MAG: 4Fe-4S binding protein [Erysipelotrichaceae bacterium]|nr:4Fe-4S binding protein [Erysipelotrichaceae bacterium]